MNFKDAEMAQHFGEIVGVDAFERPNYVIVPGHHAVHYHVKIVRTPGISEIVLSCFKGKGRDPKTGYHVISDEPCVGNSFNAICFHCGAALLLMAASCKGYIRFLSNEADAHKQAEVTKSYFAVIRSGQGKGKMFGVIKVNNKPVETRQREPGEEG